MHAHWLRTKAIDKSSNPKWNRGTKFGFTVKSGDEVAAALRVQLYDTNYLFGEELLSEVGVFVVL